MLIFPTCLLGGEQLVFTTQNNTEKVSIGLNDSMKKELTAN